MKFNFHIFKMKQTQFIYTKTFFILITLLSFLVAFSIWSFTNSYYHDTDRQDYNHKVLENLDSIKARMSRYEYVLRAGIAFFKGSTKVTREEWKVFIDSLHITEHYPGLQGIGFSKMLKSKDIKALEQEMRAQGLKTFSLKPKGKRDQYSAILYLEPLDERNQQAIGYDMFSQSIRRQAMEKARDTGQATLSGRVTLVQEIDSNVQAGMLMYLPLYQKNVKLDTVKQRQKSLIGFIYSPFRMQDLMRKIVLKQSLVNFDIYDNKTISKDHLLYSSYKKSDYQSKFHTSKILSIGNRNWHLKFSSTLAFDASRKHPYILIISLSVLAVYFFLLFIILSLIKSKLLLQDKTDELQKLLQAVEQNPSSIFITDLHGTIEYVNNAFTKITGYAKEEAIGQNPRILKAKSSPINNYTDLWNSLINGKKWKGELINCHKDGTEYVTSIVVSPIFRKDGTLSHYMSVSDDITIIKEKDKQLLQQSKLAQMGEMISMIAHQWRQPLSAIATTAINIKVKTVLNKKESLTKEEEKQELYLHEKLQLIEGYVKTLTHTIDDFRNFYKPDKKAKSQSIIIAIEKALNILKPSLVSYEIKIIQEFNCNKESLIFESEIMQVIINILKNSQDNFQEKKSKNPEIRLTTYEDNGHIILDICDNGGGIPTASLDKVFDPYFSTKSEKNGTGLGLYMSKTIIEEHHHGKLSVNNNNKGVCFKITLPSQ